jgi:hypothetical protein
MEFKQLTAPIRPTATNKRIRAVKVRLIVNNCRGIAYFTDVQLQAGTTNTGWVGHVSELQWTSDG